MKESSLLKGRGKREKKGGKGRKREERRGKKVNIEHPIFGILGKCHYF